MPDFIRTEEMIGGLLSVTITEVPTKQEAAEAAAVERHRDVLRQQLDPKRPDPSTKEIADAQAFIALAADVGVTEALAVADEAIVVAEPVDPLDPKGGKRA